MIPTGDTLKFHWQEGGSENKLAVEFDSGKNAASVAQGLAAQRNLTMSTQSAGKWDTMKGPAIGFLFAAGITWVVYSMADEMAHGEEVDIHGRRAWVKAIFAQVAKVLGPAGSLAVGGAICLGLLFWAYRRWQKPPEEHRWR
jgi:hypothetical protein